MQSRRIARVFSAISIGASVAVFAFGAPAAPPPPVSVTTYHNDNYRTGWNNAESVLTPTKVSGGSFNLLHTVALDDQVDAQPLIVNNETINGGQHNVVYVATENNSVYAIDASSGALTPEKGSPFAAGTEPAGISVCRVTAGKCIPPPL